METRAVTTHRQSIQGFALAMVDGKVIAPRILVDPGEREEVPTYYGSSDRPAAIPDVAILDDQLTPLPMANVSNGSTVSRFLRNASVEEGCLLPRAIVENTADHTALVACLGSNALLEYVIESGSTTGGIHAAVRGRWPVARGPSAVAYDPKHKQAVVWSQFDHAVTFVALPSGSLEDRLIAEKDRVTRLNLARPASVEQSGEVELGRVLYHTSGDHRISREGLACATCHPDGRDDGLTWATSDGPRNVPMLAGRLEGTAPYAWSGTSERVAEHLTHTMQRLGGSGLTQREMEALASYCMTMKVVHPGGSAPSAAAQIARGKAIFTSDTARCSSCHAATNNVFTDKKKHDVGSRALTDLEPAFDTPSLRFVGGTAPYFHDGRYATLRDLLVGTSGTMGQTSHLSKDDLDALEAYLKTL
jgi:mono/diheme cytochrome c family protein